MNFGKDQIVKKHKNLVSTKQRLTTKVIITLFKAMVFLLVLAVGAGGFLGLGATGTRLEPSVISVSIRLPSES